MVKVKITQRGLRFARGSLLPTMLLVLWWWLTAIRGYGGGILPTPAALVTALRRLKSTGELVGHIGISLRRIGQGFSLAAGLAIPFGILVASLPAFGQLTLPTLEFLRQIPPVAWIPVFILVLGIGEATKLAVIVYAAFFPIFMNTILGVTQIDPHYREVARLLQFSRWENLRELILPAATPSLVTGVRLGLSNSWRALVAAEMLAAFSGLGYMIMSARSLVRMDEVFIGIVAIGLLGSCFDWGCRVLEKHLLYWRGE
ncbi:MAG: ABC transporter permease [Firmicutes bacterium]|nr:ABC transporter permease [Bacillota bacterium]